MASFDNSITMGGMTSPRAIFVRVLTTRVAWPILLTIALLCLASLLALDLSSPDRAGRQQIHILAGCAILFAVPLLHYNLLGRIAPALYGGAIVLLVAVLLTKPINGSRRWFDLG